MLPLQSGSDQANWRTSLYPVNDHSHVGEIRRAATTAAVTQGFDASTTANIAIVATELATNLVKHAGHGQILLRDFNQPDTGGLELLALDQGPGMADLDRCLRDGYSTAGSPGTGLGAIARLSHTFEICSPPNVGTAILVRFRTSPAGHAQWPQQIELGAIHLPKTEEEVCGDAWAMEQTETRVVLLVADGLGHGPMAAQASQEAVRAFRAHSQSSPEDIMHSIHAALRSTRGAAVAVAEVDLIRRSIRYVGVGNISGTIFGDGSSRSMVSHNGTAGHIAHKIQGFDYSFPESAMLIMHSDGLTTNWRLDQFSGLAQKDPQLIAGVLYRDFNRGRDDATVVVMRGGEGLT